MTIYNSQMFYLGNLADMDVNEGNTVSENSTLALGTYPAPVLLNVDVSDGNSNGTIDDNEFGTVSGEDVTYDTGSGPTTQFIDSTIVYNIRVTLGDGSTISIRATAIQLENGDTFLTDFANNGSLDNLSVQSIELLSVFEDDYFGFFANSSVDNTIVVCFGPGTVIETKNGAIAIEDLSPGDLILTRDHGWQPLRWVGKRRYRGVRKDAPIHIAKGALGNGLPQTALLLSPQHRVLAASRVVQRMFGTPEVFVIAKALLALPNVHQECPSAQIDYWHLAFDHHEVISANGVLAESFFPGPMALKALSMRQRFGLASAFDDLGEWRARTSLARPCPSVTKQRSLVSRCVRNNRALVEHTDAVVLAS